MLENNAASNVESCEGECQFSEDLKQHRISKTTLSPEIADRSLYCGIYKWRPPFLRSSGNLIAFLAAACFISCLQSSFSGYTSSQVTTLEKRFAIGSSVIGVINSCFEVGYIFSVIYVSYVGSHGRVPVWISIGLFIMSAGSFLWSLPHFVFFDSSRTSSVSLNEQLCVLSKNTSTCAEGCDDKSLIGCSESSTIGYAFLPVFILAQLLIGAGSSPILTLTPPFIDDHVPSSKAPPMIASLYAASAMGPVIGFALGAFLLQYPADVLTRHRPFKIGPDDPEWIGAWWAGFILLGSLVFIGAIILLMFPRKLQEFSCCDPLKSKKLSIKSVPMNNGCVLSESTPMRPHDKHTNSTLETEINPDNDSEYQSPWSDFSSSRRSQRKSRSSNPHFQSQPLDSKNTWSDFSTVVCSLIGNKIYIMACFCICSEMFIVVGFASFLPKYLEMGFRINKSSSSLIAGGLIVPCGAFGILVGGIILNRFQFRRKGAIRFVLVVNLIILACMCSFFFLGCKNPTIAGLTVSYPEDSLHSRKMLSVCNANCSCNQNEWSPVCHLASDITYISPCHAGCQDRFLLNNSIYEFRKCACTLHSINNNSIVPSKITDVTKPGECDLHCHTLIPFVVLLTFLLFLTGVIQNPLLMVTMRSVDHNQRSFALGLQFTIVRLFSYLPSPIVYGRVIDGACRFWRTECGRVGDCAFVDVRDLNLYITGLGFVVKGSGLLFYFFLLYFLYRDKSADNTTFNNHGSLANEPKHLHGEVNGPKVPTVVVSYSRP
ncbi:unnamed protein product [Schistosoma mattheei]|uniref:Solute carrier organic anion transporter family member n=1 Tax=Schistosoma mattheei TaxID=31246 RepID=A0AA85BCU8_9TREM|nr:unnamed protein product [Schistosoma mattheei]